MSGWLRGKATKKNSLPFDDTLFHLDLNEEKHNKIQFGKTRTSINSRAKTTSPRAMEGSYKPLPPIPNGSPNTSPSNLQRLPPVPARPHSVIGVPLQKVLTKAPMEETNRIKWFLQNYPKVVIQSARSQKYIITKSNSMANSTSQMKDVWKGKKLKTSSDYKLVANFQYRNASAAATESKEVFIPVWDSNSSLMSLRQKKRVWTIDQYDNVKLSNENSSSSQFSRTWFTVDCFGDFFSLQCPVSGKYIGIIENNSLECKKSTVGTSELFKICIKGCLKSKFCGKFLKIRSDNVKQQFIANQPGNEETLIFEIGAAYCRIYSCSGISQKNHRRYLSCWKDQNIEGTWHLGFPLHGHCESDMGSLVEEDFEIQYKNDSYFTIRACNGLYISCIDGRLKLSKEECDNTLFDIKSCTLRKKKANEKLYTKLSSPLPLPGTYKTSSPRALIQYSPRSNSDYSQTNTSNSKSSSSKIINSSSNSSIFNPSLFDNNSTFNIDDDEEEAFSSYRQSVCLFMKHRPAGGTTLSIVKNTIPPIQCVEDSLLYLEKLVTSFEDIYETTKDRCIHGSLFLTNYRILFIPTNGKERELFEWYIPLGSLNRITTLGILEFEESSSSSCFAFEVIAKHWIQIDSSRKRTFPGYHFLSTSIEGASKEPILKLIEETAFPLDFAENPFPTKYFAFDHRSKIRKDVGWDIFNIQNEFDRQIRRYNDSQQKWNIFKGNEDFTICQSYPELMIQPYGLNEKQIAAVALHRSKKRLPVVTWIHPTNGAAFLRCSQPKQGLRSSKSQIEQGYFNLICSNDNPVIWIMDARPQINAMANRLKGAGYEDLQHYKEMKYTVRMKFLGIGNIHVMRESLRKLQRLCTTSYINNISSTTTTTTPNIDENYLSINSCCWFDHIKLLFKSAIRIAEVIHVEGQTVVLHCSDGWDRTAQLACLSQLFMDGYYRTIKGFAVLIEKDWLSFGHKFGDRTGQGSSKYKCSERSPIFVQFIDCVYQLTQQFPNHFEFNEWYLLSILEHLTSARFGTFLYNTEQERKEYDVKSNTHSLWNILLNQPIYINPNYNPLTIEEYFIPSTQNIVLWKTYYIPPKYPNDL